MARPVLVKLTPVSGPWFRLVVPASAAIAALAKANNGVANLLVNLTNGTQMTMFSVPARAAGMMTASVSDAAWRPFKGASLTKVLKVRQPWAVPAALRTAPGTPPAGCYDAGVVATDADRVTRIGELHVANQNNVRGTYHYSVQADSTFSVGFSYSANSGYTAGTRQSRIHAA